jgi:signal recognition particle GTPase
MNTATATKTPFEIKNDNITYSMQKAPILSSKNPQSENELLIILFYGVSCMGKTTFSNMM